MADGTISIDVDIPVNKVKTDAELIDKALGSIGKNAGKDLDKSFNENADKVKHTASSTAQKIKDVFDRPVKTKLDADDSDINRKTNQAKDKLDKIPKSKQTELQAKDKASSTMHKVGNEADNTGHKFHKLRDIIHGTFIGSLAAQGVSNALSAIGSKIGGVVKEGMALNAATAGIERRFKGMGLSDTWTKRYMTQIGFLKSRINATGADIANLQTSVTNWSRIGRKGAMQMVTALGAMGDRTNMTSEGYQRLAMSLMRVGSSGKVSLGSLGRIAKTAPGLYHQLAVGAGMSEAHMKALLATGKVTTVQFQKWLANSSKNAKKSFKDYAHTQAGATVRMRASWQKLQTTMTKPLFNMKTSGLNEMADLMQSRAVQSGAKMIGDGVARIAKFGLQILADISKHKADVSGVMSDLVKIGGVLVKDVWNDFAAILGDIARSFGLIHGNSAKSGSSLHTVRLAMDGLAKNKNAIKIIARAIEIMAVAKLANTANGLLHISKIAGGSVKAISGLVKGFKGVEDASQLKGTERNFYRLADIIKHPKSALNDLVKNFKNKFKVIGDLASKLRNKLSDALSGKSFKGAFQSLRSASKGEGLTTAGKITTVAAGAGVAVDTATSIVRAIKDKVGSRKQYEDVGASAGKGIGGAIGLWFGGPAGAAIGAQIGGAVGKWAGGAVKSFQNGWNRHKPPKKFWSLENLGWSARDTFSKIGKWGSDLGKNLGKGFERSKGSVKKSFQNFAKSAQDGFNGFQKWLSKLPSNMHRGWKQGVEQSHKVMAKFWSDTGKGWSNFWQSVNSNRYVKAFKKGRLFQTALSDMRSRFHSFQTWFGKNWNNTWKTAKSHWNSFKSWFGKNWSSAWKSANSNRYVKAFKKGKFFSTALKDMRSRWSSFKGWLGKNWHGFWRSTNKSAKTSWDGTVKNWNGTWKSIHTGWNSFKTSFGKSWNNFWNAIGNGLKSWGKHIENNFKGTINNVIGGFNDVVHALGGGKKTVGYLKFAGGTDWKRKYPVAAILNDGNDSPLTNNREGIIDNRNGSLSLLPNVSNLRRWLMPWEDVVNASDMAGLMGVRHFARGTQRLGMSRVNATGGTSIRKLTSELQSLVKVLRDVNKLSHIKLSAKGLSRVLKEVNQLNRTLKNIVKLGDRAVKQYRAVSRELITVSKRAKTLYETVRKHNFGKVIAREAQQAVKGLKGKGNFASAFKKLSEKFIKTGKGMSKSFHEIWSKMFKDGDKQFTDFARKDIRDLTNFKNSFEKGWRSLDNGVSRIFSKFWSNMRNSAGKGMNRVLSVINSGISRINGVIRDFGGSSHAIGHASYVRYANGTGGTLTKPTLAIVNDGNDSPETGNKESWYNHNTGEFGIFEGRNTPILAPAGLDIYKASDTRDFMHGLGYSHFANGTGGSLHYLYELTKKFFKAPQQTLDSELSTSGIGLRGAMHQLAQGMANTVQSTAEDWWKTLWTMVHKKIDGGGSASGLLEAVEKLGRGKRYVLGAWGPSAYDCSGLVSRAIQDYYHKGWGRMNVAGLWRHAHRISRSEARPGDPIFWLPNHHVGIYMGGDRYWSAFAPGARPDVGVHSIAESVPGVKPTFGRFYGISGSGKHSNDHVKANSPLEKLIRGQVGKGFWKTISKIADKYGASLGALSLSGSITKRARTLYAALRRLDPRATRNGIAAILGNWEFESGLNPSASNPNGGATGLGQWLGGRLSNLKAYARRHGGNWRNAGTQLSFALHGEGSDSAIFRRILEGHGSVQSLASAFSSEWERGGYTGQHVAGAEKIIRALGFANGGFITRPQLAVVGEGNGAEVVLPYGDPSKRERTLALMQATISQMQMQDGMSQKLDANKGTDMTVVNSAIDQINKKFDQALQALGIITAKDDNFTIISKVDEQTMSAVYRKFKKYDTQNMRRAAKNISGYQTF